MISLKKLLVKILDQFKYDYVTDKGVTNGWYYQKWHSGKRECWTTVDYTGTSSTSWGNIRISSNIALSNFPTNLFTTAPELTVDARSTEVGYQCKACHAKTAVSATNAGSVTIFRTISTTSSHTYRISVYAVEV